MSLRRTLTSLLLAAVVAVPLLVSAAPANAGLLTGLTGIRTGLLGSLLYVMDDAADELLTGQSAMTAQNCPDPVLSQPFAQWGDSNDYFMVDGGDFSSPGADQWSRSGAAITTDANPSMAIAETGAVASPRVCVGEDEPTIRFKLRAGSSTAVLHIRAMFVGTDGTVRSDDVATLYGSTTWKPSPIVWLGTNERAAAGQKIGISLVFQADRGNWQIDDVYVDPYRSR